MVHNPLLTTSNNPQANGLIERLNATITGKLRLAYLENPKASWTQLVKRITQTYNNTPHSVTSFPPTYLMFKVIPPDLRTHLNPYPEITRAREIARSRTQNKHKKIKKHLISSTEHHISNGFCIMPRRGRGRLAYRTRHGNNAPNPISPVPTEYIIGGLDIVCPYCSALHFPGETVGSSCFLMHQVELAEEHRARIENRQMCQVQMLIRQNHCRDLRRYNAPSVSEVAAIFVDQDGHVPSNRDIAVFPHDCGLVRISPLNPNCDPMTYPLLFPAGDPGWAIGILHEENMRTSTRNHVTMLQFYSYRLAIRPGFSPIHYGRRTISAICC
ncbi:hypothetical protein LAZ67_21001284 [Cordylochernes scorpioides]|uniref:Integrase catalytic domain-containing protein n=1 Tax=Cordylochernes scorpioides TaxID=51811 RepID=A0ABY6LQP7_9ARAC|nr:hypothetical protein LAZ67_21001284 [Cordylochernes scorpioides]